jgi:hypothetical protein
MTNVIEFMNEVLDFNDHPENHMSIFQIFVFKYLLFNRL